MMPNAASMNLNPLFLRHDLMIELGRLEWPCRTCVWARHLMKAPRSFSSSKRAAPASTKH